jgi:hypothetical protein
MTVTETARTSEPKRLPDPVRDDLGVMDRRHHRSREERSDEHEHHAGRH